MMFFIGSFWRGIFDTPFLRFFRNLISCKIADRSEHSFIANNSTLNIRCRAPIIFVEMKTPEEIMKVQSTVIYSHLHNITVLCTLERRLIILFLQIFRDSAAETNLQGDNKNRIFQNQPQHISNRSPMGKIIFSQQTFFCEK